MILVAGGAGAIGSEIGLACLAHGGKVAIADLSSEASNHMAASMATQWNLDADQVMGVALNVLEEESVYAAVTAVEERMGHVDVLINAVWTHIEHPAQELTLKAWDTVLDVNLRGAFLLSQVVAKCMIRDGNGGSQIHITSVRSNLGIRRGYAAYVASKGV